MYLPDTTTVLQIITHHSRYYFYSCMEANSDSEIDITFIVMSLQIFAPLQHLFTFFICNKKYLHLMENSCRVANHLLTPGMQTFLHL